MGDVGRREQFRGSSTQRRSVGFCPEPCGKARFVARADAKKCLKEMFAGESMTVYRCGLDAQYFHIGHTPYLVKRGVQSRGETAVGNRGEGERLS